MTKITGYDKKIIALFNPKNNKNGGKLKVLNDTTKSALFFYRVSYGLPGAEVDLGGLEIMSFSPRDIQIGETIRVKFKDQEPNTPEILLAIGKLLVIHKEASRLFVVPDPQTYPNNLSLSGLFPDMFQSSARAS